MIPTRPFSVFERVRHETDVKAFRFCRVLAAPSEMDAMRSSFDSQLVTMTIELASVPGFPWTPVTLNLHFEVAGTQREYVRFAAMVYRVSRRGPRSRWDLSQVTQFSGSYNARTREGIAFLTIEQIKQLHEYGEGNTLVGHTTGKVFVYR